MTPRRRSSTRWPVRRPPGPRRDRGDRRDPPGSGDSARGDGGGRTAGLRRRRVVRHGGAGVAGDRAARGRERPRPGHGRAGRALRADRAPPGGGAVPPHRRGARCALRGRGPGRRRDRGLARGAGPGRRGGLRGRRPGPRRPHGHRVGGARCASAGRRRRSPTRPRPTSRWCWPPAGCTGSTCGPRGGRRRCPPWTAPASSVSWPSTARRPGSSAARRRPRCCVDRAATLASAEMLGAADHVLALTVAVRQGPRAVRQAHRFVPGRQAHAGRRAGRRRGDALDRVLRRLVRRRR